jgi:S-adenosylmethionine hydrolase
MVVAQHVQNLCSIKVSSQYNEGYKPCQRIQERYNTDWNKGKLMDRTIALLTDFGTRDAYVGVMKAVMARICPDARFIDITHEILPQNIQQAALTLLGSYRYFAPRTVFLVVVDPGVGSSRKAIAVQAGDYTFVAPDNHVLSWVLREFPQAAIVELTNPDYQLSPVSNTFHGRDIFAPAAAHLAAGVPLSAFGSAIDQIVQQPAPFLRIDEPHITGEVIYADHFGNLITNIAQFRWIDDTALLLMPHFSILPAAPITLRPDQAVVTLQDRVVKGIRRTYGEAKKGEVMALVGSGGFLEIAINQGNAAIELNVSPGAQIILQIG